MGGDLVREELMGRAMAGGLDAFTELGRRWIDGLYAVACLILGDNLFFGHGLPEILQRASTLKQGATVFGYKVHDPHRYGVVEFDKNHKVIGIEEKPKNPKSKSDAQVTTR